MRFQGYYLASSREFTRMDSITKAPVIHHFSESIAGVMTIRSFRKQNIFCDENLKRVNANLRIDFHNYSCNEWLGFRLELIGSFAFCISAMFMIILPSSIIKPGKLTPKKLSNFGAYCLFMLILLSDHNNTSLNCVFLTIVSIFCIHISLNYSTS